MKNANAKTWKNFVVMLTDLGVKNTSSEIASVINRDGTENVTPMQVAGVRASITKKRNLL